MNFARFAEANGLLICDLREDGRIHRCPTASKPKHNNGAYLFDGRRGWVQDWAQMGEVQWWNDPTAKPWTDEEKAIWVRRQREARAERARRQHQAAADARRMLGEAELIVPKEGHPWRPGRPLVAPVPAHPYLVAKGFRLEPGFVRDGRLLIPMFEAGSYGAPIGLQQVEANGTKKFLPGQRAKGAVYRFGNGQARETWLCEGYATALTVRAALKRLMRSADVIACFSAGNLAHVASLGVGTHVMADHDKSAVGESAAIETGLPYALPGTEGMDANDVFIADGLEAVCELVAVRI